MHGTLAWDLCYATNIRVNGGMPHHATITTQHWHKIGGMTISRQQR
jgi:hypothetical protein